MAGEEKKYVYEREGRFEVTSIGLLYSPEPKGGVKRHDCPDCFFCQGCSETRCGLCRAGQESPQETRLCPDPAIFPMIDG